MASRSVNQEDMEGTFDNLCAYAAKICEENPDTHWMPKQFENHDNPLVHYNTTGPEVWEQTGNDVGVFVAGAGTGGTLNGAGKFLKEKNPDLHVVCVEPTEARVLSGGSPALHGVVGIGANIKLPLLEELAPGQAWEDGPRGHIGEFSSSTT